MISCDTIINCVFEYMCIGIRQYKQYNKYKYNNNSNNNNHSNNHSNNQLIHITLLILWSICNNNEKGRVTIKKCIYIYNTNTSNTSNTHSNNNNTHTNTYNMCDIQRCWISIIQLLK